MANQLTVDELKEELLKWQETRDFLNREIAAVEQSTTAISIWMAETKDGMYRSYFALSDALRRKDSAAFEKALDEAGELAGTVLKVPLSDGKTITESAEQVFGGKGASTEDKRVYERLSAVELEFPEHLYTPVETPEAAKLTGDTDAPLDAVVEATAKAKIEAEKEEKAEKSSWAAKMWPFGSTQKEKPADVMEKIQEVRGELLGLKTSKPFYVNSFFDWMESMHLPPEGRPEVLGDGDYSDYPEGIVELVDPIIEKGYDFVISSRQSKKIEKGSMTLPQRWGTLLAVRLVEILYDYRYSDMGSFRAIRHDKLLELGMTDRTYGWTIEMQIKALQHGLKIKEVPLPYRKRIGTSKISGTIKGVINAGCKIIWTIFKMRFSLCRK